jgi:hypothetical protein
MQCGGLADHRQHGFTHPLACIVATSSPEPQAATEIEHRDTLSG